MATKELPEEFAARVEAIEEWVDRLTADLEGIAKSLDERWPREMVREGFEDHVRTWRDTEALARGLSREIAAFGGFEALREFETDRDTATRARSPGEIVHLWPNLPGAGVTPMLYGAVLGVEQSVRPPSGGEAFARRLVEHWPAVDGVPALDVRDPDDDTWTEADVVVVSGTDATIREIRSRILEEGRMRSTTVTGYGHRVSLGVVPDREGVDLEETARGMARDAVLWNQAGCFSLRGVLVAGSEARCETFCRRLGSEIAAWERRLQAIPEADSESSMGVFERRMQARQVAEFQGRLFGDGFGWCERREAPFSGEWVSLHTVTCHPVDGAGEVPVAIDVDPWHLQGAACPKYESSPEWCEQLARAGVTRVCAPGRLQAPPPDWAHDGRLNIGEWLRATTCDR